MCVQEEITQGVVSLSVETGKMTADLLQKAVKKVLEEMQKKPSQRSLHQGKQTLHQLKQHGASLTNIEITEQNIKAFSAVAKKYDIDYALKKDPTTDPPHYGSSPQPALYRQAERQSHHKGFNPRKKLSCPTGTVPCLFSGR